MTSPRPAPNAFELYRFAPWTIYETDEHSDETRKLTWFAVHEDTGETRDIDLSPHARRASRDTFWRLAKMGFPTRDIMQRCPNGPLSPDDVSRIWDRQYAPKVRRLEARPEASERARVGA